MLLTDILKKAADFFPDRPALTMKMGYRKKQFTYLQVYNKAKKFALFLKKIGIKKGDKILIFAPNSPYWGIVYWGSLLRGSILVPLNIQSTSEMIRKIAEQTVAEVIFKSKYLRQDLPENLKNYDIEFLEELIDKYNERTWELQKDEYTIDENDLIQILYTSGTTGEPKGVLLTHKNIYSNVIAVADIISLKEAKESLLSILPLTHIFEQTIGFFLAQFYCAQIVYVHSYSAITDLLNEYKINKMLAVPEFLKVLISKIRSEYEKKGKLKFFNLLFKVSSFFNNKIISKLLFYPVHKKFGKKLDTIASGGAFLDPDLEKNWNFLGFYILQGYGLTETSPVISCNTYKERRLGSVGKVIKNVVVKLADDHNILVKGPSVFSGYFKNEEITKDVFTSDGYFKTGDIGKFDKDKFLFLKGRKKYEIVGSGGQNVFPEDIEIELNKIKGIKDSCVLGLPLKGGIIQIHAVLLLDPLIYHNNLSEKIKHEGIETIINLVNTKLASYQRINGFTVWPYDDFPRSATRKIKKEEVLKKLQDIQAGKVEKNTQKNKTQLIKILSQITGFDINEITPKKKIIQDLQLDSLMQVELIVRIEEELGVLVDEFLIASKITVAQLQEIIDKNEPIKKKNKLKKWPRSWWACIIRFMLQPIIFLLAKLFFKLQIQGKENLNNLDLPVIFMPNHVSYVDPVVFSMVLPYYIRKKLAFAAAQDVLYEEFKKYSWLAELLFNSFSLPRTNGENIKQGLEFVGQLLDKGYSIVVFPEGKISKSGQFQTLRRGAGFMSVEMRCQIVPIKLIGVQKVIPYCKFLPRKFRSLVTIKIGKPIKFKLSDSYDVVTKKIEKVMREL